MANVTTTNGWLLNPACNAVVSAATACGYSIKQVAIIIACSAGLGMLWLVASAYSALATAPAMAAWVLRRLVLAGTAPGRYALGHLIAPAWSYALQAYNWFFPLIAFVAIAGLAGTVAAASIALTGYTCQSVCQAAVGAVRSRLTGGRPPVPSPTLSPQLHVTPSDGSISLLVMEDSDSGPKAEQGYL